MWNAFFLDTATNLKEREFFLVEPVSSLLKLLCNLKHLSCKQFHNIVNGDFTFIRNLRKLQNIHGLNRLSFALFVLTETSSKLDVLLQCLKRINKTICYLTC